MVNTVILREGWDMYSAIADANTGVTGMWTGPVGNSSLVAGRFGGQALKSTNTGSPSYPRLRRSLDSTTWEAAIGVVIKAESLFPYEPSFHSFVRVSDSGGVSHLGVGFGAGGSLTVIQLGGGGTSPFSQTVLAQSDFGILNPNVWHYIEIELLVDNTIGFCRVYVDGNDTPCINLTGADTKLSVNPISHLEIMPMQQDLSTHVNMTFDDIYVTDHATRLGPRRIQTLRVNGNGVIQDWTPSTGTDHAACIDEVLANTTDYISASTLGAVDQFTMTNLASDPLTIDEVNLVVYCEKTDGGTRAVKTGLKSGGTTSESTDIYLANGIARQDRVFTKDPNGNIAWDGPAVDALVTQVKVSV